MKNINKHITVVGVLYILLNLISMGAAVFFGWYFDARFLPVANILFSIPGLIAGYGLTKRKPWARTLGLVMAALNLMTFPHGTALGIYSLVVLVNDEARGKFVRVESSSP